ncbi:hypothetical protein ES288_D05G419300v1 [Gossypium darwinii]|uniref:Uncharacterized protein n=1 Tax=Gossypium darwinii TaxID=34276 RepID=A0A5D2CU27_GOSDA|nr:hypothetical protein ES288_D05G419300v1 [Gossypium darwinii]
MGRGHGTKRRGEREELRPLLEPTSGDGESPSTAGLGADSGNLLFSFFTRGRPVVGEPWAVAACEEVERRALLEPGHAALGLWVSFDG